VNADSFSLPHVIFCVDEYAYVLNTNATAAEIET
jgi:hypothetical protein